MITPDDVTVPADGSDAPTLHVAQARSGDTRFTPGTTLLGRYRIINLVGRGGMGEVYRADDLKLGQQVALKFVPRDLARDPQMLAMLLSEVRIGRDVAHPNVCRLYDVVEVDGDHFISMQFVDGEDLGSLLRRIGRLPVEKALDVARDIAAGLAAAHDRGVIHRDLKPANVMIDGKGRAHVTDFGLAVLADDVQRTVAGTPVYMAPEQLGGAPATAVSDVYALGLIMFEMLTGRRLFHGGALSKLLAEHAEPKPSLASSVRDLPPRIEALIMACIDEDPAERVPSARAVLAALPGGDPLAAAVAAGETPSPELVAAASRTGELPARIAIGGFVLFLALLAGIAIVNPRVRLYSSALLRKPPEALVDRAEDVVRASGIASSPEDRAWFFVDRKRTNKQVPERDRVVLVYRRAAEAFTPSNVELNVTPDDPPLLFRGSATTQITGDGRLVAFTAVPTDGAQAAPDALTQMIRAAGYDPAALQSVAPAMAPPVGCDRRFAWDGAAHIEAAAYHGQIVWFEVAPVPRVPPKVSMTGIGSVGVAATALLLIPLGAFIAWRNVRAQRQDVRGAWRSALIILALLLPSTVLRAHFGGDVFSIVTLIDSPMLTAFVFSLFYLASEPYVRRRMPVVLVSWQRLMDGRWRDSLVARDISLGMLTGVFVAFAVRIASLRQPVATSSQPFLVSLGSTTGAMSWVLHAFPEAMMYGVAATLIIVLLSVWLRRPAIYIPVVMLAVGTTGFQPRTGSPLMNFAFGVAEAGLMLWVIRLGGMLAVVVGWFVAHMIDGLPLTLDFSAWFAPRALVPIAALIVLAAFAFYATVRRRGSAFATASAAA